MKAKIDITEVAAEMYSAYHTSCKGTAVNGDELPLWVALPKPIKKHWKVAAAAALSELGYQLSGVEEALYV